MDYYFGDELRWTLGFENPNKAAALIASALPLVWIGYRLGRRSRSNWWRWPVFLVCGAALVAGWWLLFKTYSRGGIVAAGAAFVYMAWRMGRAEIHSDPQQGQGMRWAAPIGWLLLVGALFISTSAAKRSTQWMEKQDGSVNNRVELWKGGLRMIAEIPRGVGGGNSGEAYMQWFQPLEQKPRYRTLVNSYLTFIAEQGLAVSALAAFLALCVWHGTAGHESAGGRLIMIAGLRASIVAFLIAGLFSTTMEEMKLWIIPTLSLLGLLCLAIRQHESLRLARVAGWAAATALLICAAIWLSGSILARNDPLKITRRGERITIFPANTASASRVHFAVDRSVLGNDYGKLLRRLAQSERLEITVAEDHSPPGPCDILVLTGDTIQTTPPSRAAALILIAPAVSDPATASQLLSANHRIAMLLPAFDEDGRVRFWEDILRDEKHSTTVQTETLDGVGTQIEWAWEQVAACIHRLE